MKKHKIVDAKKLDALNKRNREKQKNVIQQIKRKKIENNQAILHEMFLHEIRNDISLEDLIEVGFKDDKAVKSDSRGSAPLIGSLVFHECTHYGIYDLLCVDNDIHKFNIVETGNSFQKAQLLNYIRDKEIEIEALRDLCTDCRFENNSSMEKYYEELRNVRINELGNLKNNLKALIEEEKED
jgi:hypothetical protein